MAANNNPYGHQAARPRPVLNNEEGGSAIAAKGRGAKRAPGFAGGFKAPPATDLIDQLLLEQDQNSMKKKSPLNGLAGRQAGFARGFKAPPKTDMIDALLLAGDDDDDEEEYADIKLTQEDSLKNDGKPANIKQ